MYRSVLAKVFLFFSCVRGPAVLPAADSSEIQALHTTMRQAPSKDVLEKLTALHLKNKSYKELSLCFDFMPNFYDEDACAILAQVCNSEGGSDFLRYLNGRMPYDDRRVVITGEESLQVAYVVGLLNYYHLIDDEKSNKFRCLRTDFKCLFERAAMPRAVDGRCVMHPGAMFMLGQLSLDEDCPEKSAFYWEYALAQGALQDQESVQDLKEFLKKHDWQKRSWLNHEH